MRGTKTNEKERRKIKVGKGEKEKEKKERKKSREWKKEIVELNTAGAATLFKTTMKVGNNWSAMGMRREGKWSIHNSTMESDVILTVLYMYTGAQFDFYFLFCSFEYFQKQ